MNKLLICLVSLFAAFSGIAQDKEYTHLMNRGNQLVEKNKPDSAKIYFDSCMAIIKSQKPEALNGFYLNIGASYRNARQFKFAEIYYNKALRGTDSVSKPIELIDIYNEIGLHYYQQNQYTKSLSELTKSMKYSLKLKDTLGLMISYLNIGNVFKDIEDYSQALKYYKKALQLSENNNDFKVKCHNNIGIVYLEEKNYKMSLYDLNIALNLAKKNNLIPAESDALINIGIINYRMGDITGAKSKFQDALPLKNSVNDKYGKLLCLINLYNIEFLQGNSTQADYYERQAIHLSDSIDELTSKIDLYKFLSANYATSKNFEKAYLYKSKLLDCELKLKQQARETQLDQYKSDAHYQQVVSEMENLETKLSTEMMEKEKMAKEIKWIIFLSVVSVILLLSLVIILMKSNKKNKNYTEILKVQAEALAEKNNQIVNSMEYANSMERMLIQQMNPHFIFNCLTTIQASISIGDVKYTQKYLQVFSSILRKTLDYSMKPAIPLIEEINFLKTYIELNQLREADSFLYDFIYDEEEVDDFVNTPPMLVQPFIENAILHGLYPKTEGPKNIQIRVEPKTDFILWTITDNGIGRIKSAEIKKQHSGTSHGTQITSDRIKWMKNIYKQNLSFEYVDLEQGTQVLLKTPIIEN